ncbi:MAG: GGDEF domain-containing protein, partial [Clostridia bacterium]|nr:GGDEF domain-containing protein [Clostridia bacterium]
MIDDMILRFFRDDIGGIRITGASGEVLYEDEKTAFIGREKTNWAFACPPLREGQRGEAWDLLHSGSGKSYMVISSTLSEDGRLLQIHHLVDTSLYMEIYREMTDYSKHLQEEKSHDSLTGLYNKGKFLEMKRTVFREQDAIAVFNMDVNDLKRMNDTYGHEAGDKLIKKAAESLHRIEKRNVLPFRVGGDEFVVVAIHVTREEAERLRRDWEAGLTELNQREDGIQCVIACGFVYGEAGY